MLKHGTEMCDKMAPEMIDILKANHYDAIIVDTTYIPCSWMVTNQLKVQRHNCFGHFNHFKGPLRYLDGCSNERI